MSFNNNAAKKNSGNLFRLNNAWKYDSVFTGGVPIPDLFFSINKYIYSPEKHISPQEMIILLRLLSLWKGKPSYPAPSKSVLADEMGLSSRQIQRILSSLEEKGYIAKISQYENNARVENVYDLTGIVSLIMKISIDKRKREVSQ